MKTDDVVILGGARTPFGTFGGALRDVSGTDLAVIAAKAAMERSHVDPRQIGHVIMGNDAPASLGQRIQGNNVTMNLETDTRAETERLFAALKVGGTVEYEPTEMPWGVTITPLPKFARTAPVLRSNLKIGSTGLVSQSIGPPPAPAAAPAPQRS